MAENYAEFTVEGVDSESAAAEIERGLEAVNGIMEADVDGESGDAVVRFDLDLLSEERVRMTVRDMGYELA
jgi:copper chaperone CopZ